MRVFAHFDLVLLQLPLEVGHRDGRASVTLDLNVLYLESRIELLLVRVVYMVLVFSLLISAVMSFDHLRVLLIFNTHQSICRVQMLVVTLLLDLIDEIKRPWHQADIR